MPSKQTSSDLIIYSSKISFGLLSMLIISLAFIGAVPIYQNAPTHVIIILLGSALAAIGIIIHSFLSTAYWVENEHLRIKAGIMNNLTIPVEKIRKIEKTNSWLASPAASFDRIEIHYEKWNSIIISPKDKRGLIAELKTLNPSIEVRL